MLPFVVEKGPSPATNATWAWTLRRFARATVWLLPGYAILFGVVALTRVGGGPAPYAAGGRLWFLVGWIIAVWLGVLALMALTSLLAVARSRRIALAGLLVGLGGTLLMLPFAGMPEDIRVYGVNPRVLALVGGTVYTVGWLLAGWAIIRSGVFSYADGGMLMAAAPLLGVGGLAIGALQAYGAMLALASGIGVALRAGRLVPAGPATPIHAAAVRATPEAVTAAQVPATGTLRAQ
jgi:small-conductance mechanosensitive channel